MSNAVEGQEITYGNLHKPKLPGIGRLSAGASLFLVISAAVLMVLLIINLWISVAFAVVVGVLIAPTLFPTKDGYGRYASILRTVRHRGAESEGRTMLAQGLTGRVPTGECGLPGMAASTRLSTFKDIHGREFGLISWPTVDLHSVVIQTYPAGFNGLDKAQIDHQVAHWGAWLGSLNGVGDVVGASVVVDTAPDSGQRLTKCVQRGRVDSSPEFSRTVTDQILASYKIGSPTLTTRITITFSGCGDDDAEYRGKGRTVAEMAVQIGDVLPELTGSLDETGAGTAARPCTAQEIADFTRVAFDPSVASLVEHARENGGTGITWSQAGPIAAHNAFDRYEHESAVSRVWQMKEPAGGGVFFATTLRSLLAPHKDLGRKRVTLLYRPETPAASVAAAESEIKKATFVTTQKRRASAGAKAQLRAAERTAEQEQMGSPLVRIGLLVTVTVMDEADLPRASRAVITGLTPKARLTMRLPKGAQDVSFLAGMALGMVPALAMRTPKATKEDVA